MNRKLKRSAFEIEIFCNKYLYCHFWLMNASLHNKCITFFQKQKRILLTPNFSVLQKDLVHISRQNMPVKNNLTPEMCDCCCINYNFYLQFLTLTVLLNTSSCLWNLKEHYKSIFSPADDFDGTELSDQVCALLYFFVLLCFIIDMYMLISPLTCVSVSRNFLINLLKRINK